MNTVSVSLATLINNTVLRLEGSNDRALVTTINDAIDADDTSITVADAAGISISDVLELESESVLVTAKTDDAVPVITIARGYYFSTAATHAAATVCSVNTRYPRVRIATAIQSAFGRMEALGLPLVMSDNYSRTTDKKYVLLPAATRDVLAVYYTATDGRLWPLDGWTYFDTMDPAEFATGKILRLPRYLQNEDSIQIVTRIPYRWDSYPDPPDDTAEITLYEGTEDLPCLYACAWLLASREISRMNVDRAEEWNQGEASRGGISASVLRLQWQEFYRSLEEAKRLVPAMPVHRPYRRTPRLTK